MIFINNYISIKFFFIIDLGNQKTEIINIY
jgi:hypothetical protein